MVKKLLLSDKTFFKGKKQGLISVCEVSPLCYFCCATKLKITWAKLHILADSRLADANKRRPE
ncbi:MAG: hypothetical protein MJZ22_04915, partial [Candidatus Saccharibacteria bacterium]|nr:hypothetical protein [Candidatus Saccharibacteria bacterium]